MEKREIDGRFIKSNETLFSIIECLKEGGEMGITDIANQLDLAKSTVHKHLVSLERHRYVVKSDGQYRLGLEFFHKGVHVRNSYDVYHAAKDRIDRLASETEEAAWLISHENGLGMFIYGVSHNNSFSFDSTIGRWVHLHANSAGKAILAYLPEDTVLAIIEQHGLPAQTDNTITEREMLFAELEDVRERGYAMNSQEDLRGLHAIAAPIIRNDRPVAAVTIAGAANRLTKEHIEEELCESLFEAVDDIELRLVYG